jgi:hypothetical protein
MGVEPTIRIQNSNPACPHSPPIIEIRIIPTFRAKDIKNMIFHWMIVEKILTCSKQKT